MTIVSLIGRLLSGVSRIGYGTAGRKPCLALLASDFQAAVVLDLAAEMLAGATMEDVSTVLFTRFSQWARYPKKHQGGGIERMVGKDGRRAELHERVGKEMPG
jgi:hypothetical protein